LIEREAVVKLGLGRLLAHHERLLRVRRGLVQANLTIVAYLPEFGNSLTCWKSDGTASQSATSYAVSDSGVWAVRAARICAS